ncbi:MAG: hypothetical protein ACJ8AK_16325 [Gemmatimonadaceae bacterium]
MIFHPLVLTIGLALPRQDTLQYDASIYGKITSADTTFLASIAPALAPISYVIIDIAGPGAVPRQLTADDSGSYSLTGLAGGVYTLRFIRAGYVTLSLDVRVPEHGAVHLDISLDPAPPTMKTIKVLASDATPRIRDNPVTTGAYQPWRLDGNRMRTLSSLDFPDVIRAVGTSPQALAGPESSSGLHLQGGATNHTLLLVDGIPLYNAVHAGDHPSAMDPDAVADITSYSEAPARTGDRLGGVVEVNTRRALPDSEHVTTSIWPTGIRALTALQFTGGSALIGARRNYARPLERDEREPVTLRPTDVFATASVPFGGGSLTGLFISSSDAISFDAAADLPSGRGNRFGWTSDARGLTWQRRAADGGFSVDARVWQSGTSVGVDWIPASESEMRMANQFTQTAAAASASWGEVGAVTTIGGSFEQLRGGYSVADTAQADAMSFLGIHSHLGVVSAFIEHSRELGRFTATLGERIAVVGQSSLLMEPRAAFGVSLFRGVSLSGAFARTHQYTQSLYNDESIVDAMAALEAPVIAGSAGVPIATSTSGSLQLMIPVGSSALITASTYLRTFDALILAGAAGGDPFAATAFTSGHGTAYGTALNAREQLGRLNLQGTYSMSIVSREWAGERSYRPTFAPSHAALIAAGYQLGDNTLFRASGFMSALRSTSPLLGGVAFEWQDVLASQREVSGSPEYSPSTLGAGRLEPYVRVDVGIRHKFTFGSLRSSAYLNVDNLLARRNAAGLVEDPSGAGTRTLGMMPRSISFGVGLRF